MAPTTLPSTRVRPIARMSWDGSWRFPLRFLRETPKDTGLGAFKVLARNSYDASSSLCSAPPADPALGKLAMTESYDDNEVQLLTQKYCYQQLNGRLSRELTVFNDWPGLPNLS